MNYQSHNQTKSVWKTTLVIVAVLLICAGLRWLSVNFGTNKKLSSQGRDDNVGSNYYPHQSNTKPQTPHVEYDPQTGHKTKDTIYNSDGKTIRAITEYDPQTGNEIKYTLYNSDGTIRGIYEHDPQTGNEIKETSYNSDGKTIRAITEYDPQTENKIKYTLYNSDGKTIDFITEYDPQTGNRIKKTWYNYDGTFKKVQTF